MKSRLLSLIGLFIITFLNNSADASHILGHEIFYSIDASGNADISVVIYRDCYGIDAPLVTIINAVSSCGDSLALTANQTGQYGNEVWQILPFDEYEMVQNCPSTCGGNGFSYGVQRFVYSVSVQLSSCGEWRFSQQFCCISAAVDNLVSAGSNESRVSTYAFLVPNQPNFSPRFVASSQNICVNSGEAVLQSAYDIDGDSLVYSFCPLFNEWLLSDTIVFESGASSSQPFVGQTVVLDPNDGIIMTPINSQAQTMIGVQIDEYRNGILIGRTQRASHIRSFSCQNQTTGSINTTVLQGNVVNGELQPTVGSEVIVEYTSNVSDPTNFYLYCTTCEHLEDYNWTTTSDIPNGVVSATLNWIPVVHELEVPIHVRLLQETCDGNLSSTTMLYSIQQGSLTEITEFSELDVNIYPNPGNLFFTVKADEEILSYQLIDLSGRILINEILAPRLQEIGLELDQPDGSYLLRICTPSGLTLHKIIIAR